MKTLLILPIVCLLLSSCMLPPKTPPEYDYDSTPTHDGEEYGGFSVSAPKSENSVTPNFIKDPDTGKWSKQ